MAWFLNFYRCDRCKRVDGPMNGPACVTTSARTAARET